MVPDNRLATERFPRSSKYHPEWILASVSGGANSLWLAEAMDLRAGMRVLDSRVRPGRVVDLPPSRVRRADLGHRPVVQRR